MARRQCAVCTHFHVREINERLLLGESRRSLAREYGINRNSIDRHWWQCIPQDVKAAAGVQASSDGEVRLDVIDGTLLLGQMARVYERAVSLLDTLEDDMATGDGKVDRRAVVAALREVRQSLVDLAKLNDNVADRQSGTEQEHEDGAIDAAILKALEARDVQVNPQDVPRSHEPWPVPALEAGPPS